MLSRAIGLREALYRLFSQAGSRRRPAGEDLGVLQAEVTGALAHFRVAWSPAGFGQEDGDQASSGLDRMLWPVAWSAAELLVQGPLERIRECPGQDTCGWLFLDVSKNTRSRLVRHARVRQPGQGPPPLRAHASAGEQGAEQGRRVRAGRTLGLVVLVKVGAELLDRFFLVRAEVADQGHLRAGPVGASVVPAGSGAPADGGARS